jgi:hypothetical protein
VGHDVVGLGDLHFATDIGTLSAADLSAVEPVSGAAQAQRVVTTGACPAGADRDEVCHRFPEPEPAPEPGE